MSKYLIDETTLTNIAKAIRTKKGTDAKILTDDFATEILSIPQDGSETLSRLIDKTISEIVIPEDVTEIGGYVFFLCSELSKVTLHDNIVRIRDYAFGNTRINGTFLLPKNTVEIGAAAFRMCYDVQKFIFGNSLQSIGGNAFQGCTKCLEYDFSKCESIPTLGTNAFQNINANAKIIVPATLYSKWVISTNWVTWKDYIEPKDAIKFSAGGSKYAATDGMTWREWVNSEYAPKDSVAILNAAGQEVVAFGYVDPEFGFVAGSGYVVEEMTEDYSYVTYVKPDDLIEPNRVYRMF